MILQRSESNSLKNIISNDSKLDNNSNDIVDINENQIINEKNLNRINTLLKINNNKTKKKNLNTNYFNNSTKIENVLIVTNENDLNDITELKIENNDFHLDSKDQKIINDDEEEVDKDNVSDKVAEDTQDKCSDYDLKDFRGRPSSCVFVASLSSALTDQELYSSVLNHFKQWGNPVLVKVLRDLSNRPYAFVQFPNDEEAKKAITEGQHSVLNGRSIRCERAKVNRTLFIAPAKETGINNKNIKLTLSEFGEIEQLVGARDDNTHINLESSEEAKQWFCKFAYRDDAINAYANLRTKPSWTVEWAQNLENEDDHLPNVTIDKFSIFIGQLHSSITKDELIKRFEKHGDIKEIVLVNRPITNFAFVKYENEGSAARAVERENHVIFGGKSIHVQYREMHHTNKKSKNGDGYKLSLAPPPVHLPNLQEKNFNNINNQLLTRNNNETNAHSIENSNNLNHNNNNNNNNNNNTRNNNRNFRHSFPFSYNNNNYRNFKSNSNNLNNNDNNIQFRNTFEYQNSKSFNKKNSTQFFGDNLFNRNSNNNNVNSNNSNNFLPFNPYSYNPSIINCPPITHLPTHSHEPQISSYSPPSLPSSLPNKINHTNQISPSVDTSSTVSLMIRNSSSTTPNPSETSSISPTSNSFTSLHSALQDNELNQSIESNDSNKFYSNSLRSYSHPEIGSASVSKNATTLSFQNYNHKKKNKFIMNKNIKQNFNFSRKFKNNSNGFKKYNKEIDISDSETESMSENEIESNDRDLNDYKFELNKSCEEKNNVDASSMVSERESEDGKVNEEGNGEYHDKDYNEDDDDDEDDGDDDDDVSSLNSPTLKTSLTNYSSSSFGTRNYQSHYTYGNLNKNLTNSYKHIEKNFEQFGDQDIHHHYHHNNNHDDVGGGHFNNEYENSNFLPSQYPYYYYYPVPKNISTPYNRDKFKKNRCSSFNSNNSNKQMYHYKSGYNNYRVNSIVHNEERETKNHGSKISRVPSTSSSSSSSNSVSASVSPPSERVSIDHQEMMSPMVPSIPLPPPPPPPFSNLYFPSFPIPPLPFEPIMFPQMMPTMNPCLNQKSFPVHHNNNINNSNTDSNIDDNENDSHNTGMISQQIQPHPEFFPPHMVDFRQMYPYFMVYNTGIPPPNGLIRSEDYNYIEGENNSHLVNEESGILLENS
ncbi:organic cyclic compound binding protein [[Candida] boidinii]|nr:organic cyclic compound binding protein [[Candida] boidinii]